MKSGRTGAGLALAFLLAGMVIITAPAFAETLAPDSDAARAKEMEAVLARSEQLEKELQARISALEKVQQHLLEQTRTTPSQAAATSAAPETAPPAPPPEAHSLAAFMDITMDAFDWILTAIFVVLTITLAVVLSRYRSRARNLYGELPPSTPDPALGLLPGAYSSTPLPDWDANSPAFDLSKVEIFAPEAKIMAHDSAIELAEIMLSFGRVNSAAETLAAFIQKFPKVALTPWLKLLEVYRESGQRTEFNEIANKLSQTFNAPPVTWDNFDQALDPAQGIEQIPHILERLCQSWGTRVCQAYLQQILRNPRQKLSLAAIDDIICLDALLEHHLGPYTGPLLEDDDMDGAAITEKEPGDTSNE
ncbi:MAG: hypothetical protein LBB76_01010 [Azoarcus sp.]|nr:hypothetical protein [Azoarcus sp.]